MATTIKLPDDLAKELGQFANRDESWSDAVVRVLKHTDTDAARVDRDDRATTYPGKQPKAGRSGLNKLEDGTVVRHKYRRGKYAGEAVEAIVQGGRLAVEGDSMDTRTPSGAASVADEQYRGEDARSGGWNGWEWWEYQNEDGEWIPLKELDDDES